MNRLRAVFFALLSLALFLTACQDAVPTVSILNPIPTDVPTAPPSTPGGSTNATPAASAPTPTALPPAQEAYCPNGGAITAGASEQLAAKVNGDPVPLALYQRMAQGQQAALIAQGLDPKSKQGQDALSGIQQQALGQLIDDVLVEQAAKEVNLTVSDQDVNSRIQQMVDDAGGKSKFDDYLKNTQTTLPDLCIQIRSTMFGELMLNRVSAQVPTQVEQVHVAHILLATQDDANKVLALLKAGGDFTALAKQYSKDETTRDNGGDLGWLPRGIMPPEFEAVAFQLQPGQISDVVSTPLGFHIIKVLEHADARDLSPDMLQNQKQQAFLAWLDARRNQAKIEKYVNP